MFRKLYGFVATLALAAVLAGGGFAGYLRATGRLTGPRLEKTAAVLRGELDEAGAKTDTGGTDVMPAAAEVPRAPTEEEVRQLRRREHLEMLEAERAARDLEAQRRLLDQALQHVMQEHERLVTERTEFTKQREKIKEVARDEGFQKELEIVVNLQPRQAKEHVLRTWQKQPADAIRLLNALDEATVKRIFDQFRTPEELKIQTDLLEQIRLQGIDSYARTSGTADGSSAP